MSTPKNDLITLEYDGHVAIGGRGCNEVEAQSGLVDRLRNLAAKPFFRIVTVDDYQCCAQHRRIAFRFRRDLYSFDLDALADLEAGGADNRAVGTQDLRAVGLQFDRERRSFAVEHQEHAVLVRQGVNGAGYLLGGTLFHDDRVEHDVVARAAVAADDDDLVVHGERSGCRRDTFCKASRARAPRCLWLPATRPLSSVRPAPAVRRCPVPS